MKKNKSFSFKKLIKNVGKFYSSDYLSKLKSNSFISQLSKSAKYKNRKVTSQKGESSNNSENIMQLGKLGNKLLKEFNLIKNSKFLDSKFKFSNNKTNKKYDQKRRTWKTSIYLFEPIELR